MCINTRYINSTTGTVEVVVFCYKKYFFNSSGFSAEGTLTSAFCNNTQSQEGRLGRDRKHGLPSRSPNNVLLVQPQLSWGIQTTIIHRVVVSLGQELDRAVFSARHRQQWFRKVCVCVCVCVCVHVCVSEGAWAITIQYFLNP